MKQAAVTVTRVKKSKFQKVLVNFRNHWRLYILLILPVIYTFTFKYRPMYGILIAFKQFNMRLGITASPWADPWFKWFRNFFTSPQLTRLLGNTITLSLYSMFAGFFPPIILAILINEMPNRILKKSVQTITYIPHFLSTVIVCGILTQILSLNGMVNNLLRSIGLQPIQFMGKGNLFPHIYVWSGVWQGIGYNSIVYIAALAGISPELHEAATVDGANIWQRIWYVDIPGILPTAVILLILNSSHILSVGFEKVYLLSNDLNRSRSDVISTYVYRVGLGQMEYSLSTAVGLFQSVVSLMMMFIVNTISKRVSETSLW